MTAAVRFGVVVVDDQDDLRRALAELVKSDPRLELLGTAVDAAGAVALCERVSPAVAVVDVMMPGGGAAAARGIRARSSGTQVVALSARDDREARRAMAAAGAAGYVVKGGSVAALLDEVVRVASAAA